MNVHRVLTSISLEVERPAGRSHSTAKAASILVGVLAVCLCAGRGAEAQHLHEDLFVANGTVYTQVLSGNTLYLGGDFTEVGYATGGGALIGTVGTAVRGFPKILNGTGGGDVQGVAVAVPDGSGGWFIGGSFTAVGGVPRNNLAHILADNSVAPWAPEPDGNVRALAISGSTIYVGGDFTHIDGRARSYIAALDVATGDASLWRPDADSRVYALAVVGSTVYAGGDFTNIGNHPRQYIACLDRTTNTNNATAWNPNANSFVRALAVAGNTVYAGGYFTDIGGQTRHFLAALDAATNTNNATLWNPSATNVVFALAVAGTTLYAGGAFGQIGGQPRQYIAGLDLTTNSNNATAWNPNADAPVLALAVAGTTVYAGGYFSEIGGQPRHCLAALDAATNSNNATAWNPSVGGGSSTLVNALAVDGSTVYAGGNFVTLEAVSRSRLAAFDVTTGKPTSWDPTANSTVNAVAMNGTTIYVGGSFTHAGGKLRNGIAAIDASGTVLDSWLPTPNPGTTIYALAVSGQTVYAGGYFTSIGGELRDNIAALDATTGDATTWNPVANGIVRVLLATGSTIYAGGDFSNIGGKPRANIAALDATSNATDWDPAANGAVWALAASGTTVYAGGLFSTIGGQQRGGIAALDANTNTNNATSWNPSEVGICFALAVSPGVVYAGGSLNIGQVPRYVVALNIVSGNAEPTWTTTTDSPVRTLTTGSARVYAGGDFTYVGIFKVPHGFIAAMDDVPTTVPALVSLVSALAEPGRVSITWLAEDPLALATIERRTVMGAWEEMGRVSADGTGRIAFEDRAVSPGLRYGYRLRLEVGAGEVLLGETWIDVPPVALFALAGLRPNPAVQDAIVEFSLPDGEPTRLELIDVSGRRIAAQDVGTLGPGNHVVHLAPGRHLAPGVYLLRLTRASESITARAVVIR